MDRAHEPVSAVRWSPWRVVVVTGVALGVLSLVADIQTRAQLEGQAEVAKFLRTSIGKVLSSGTLWASLPMLAGFVVTRVGPARLPDLARAAAAGVVSSILSLGSHYGLGQVVGIFAPGSLLGDNIKWFMAALIFSPVMGVIGAVARQPSWLGWLAGLAPAVGGLLEPLLYKGSFMPPAVYDDSGRVPEFPWSNVWSDRVSGVVLMVGAIAYAWWWTRRHRRLVAAVPDLNPTAAG